MWTDDERDASHAGVGRFDRPAEDLERLRLGVLPDRRCAHLESLLLGHDVCVACGLAVDYGGIERRER